MSKAFAWSFSRVKNFETCAKKYYEVDVAKTYADTSEQLTWGNSVHDALAKACVGTVPLPITMTEWQKWVDQMRYGPGELLVEKKYAIDKNFRPTEWFSNTAWFRAVVDVARVNGPVALARDWKTGKILDDSIQLALEAAVLFAHFPGLQRIRTEYVWLKDDCVTGETFDRKDISDMWLSVLPRVEQLEQATATQTFPPRPSRLCFKHCPVSSCPYHGKRQG